MRLLTTKLYRAFPELDRFTDEQCVRFIRATEHGWRRWVHVSLVGFVGLGGIIGAMALAAYLIKDAAKGRELFEVAVFASAIAVGPILAIIARDLLLRRRVRRVLRTRAGCTGCGYHLLGLTVSANNTIVCPECGTVSDVDPSLGELVLDEAGRAKYQPSVVPLPPPRIFTPSRVRVIKRTAQVVALLIFVGGPLLWGIYEVWLHQQTERARGDRVPVQKLVEMAEAVQPVPVDGADNAWDVFATVRKAMETARARVDATSPNAKDPQGNTVFADFTHIYAPSDVNDPSFDVAMREDWKRQEVLAREYLAAYKADGVFELTRKMAAAPIALATINVRPGEPLAFAQLDEIGLLRNVARLLAARIKLAQDAGDVDEATQCFEELLALSRMSRLQPRMIQDLIGIAFESLAASRARQMLATHPSEEVLKKMEAAMARQLPTLPRDRGIIVEKLSALDLIAFGFSDKKYTRLGRYSENALNNWTGGSGSELPLGSYAENREAMERYFSAYEKLAMMERWQRPKVLPPVPSHLRMLEETGPNLERTLHALDMNDVERRGLRTMVALERYYAAHKAYPPDLASLVPAFLPELPVDPWSGKPLCYVIVDPATDPQKRGYLLYSVGNDGVDDGGRSAGKNQQWNALAPSSTGGVDYIVNDIDR